MILIVTVMRIKIWCQTQSFIKSIRDKGILKDSIQGCFDRAIAEEIFSLIKLLICSANHFRLKEEKLIDLQAQLTNIVKFLNYRGWEDWNNLMVLSDYLSIHNEEISKHTIVHWICLPTGAEFTLNQIWCLLNSLVLSRALVGKKSIGNCVLLHQDLLLHINGEELLLQIPWCQFGSI